MRQNSIQKFFQKHAKRIGILAAIFVVALLLFNLLNGTSSGNTDTTDLSEASLPVLTFTYNDSQVNICYGYTSQMDITAVRDTITPIGDDLTLSFILETDDVTITGVSYQLRELEEDRLLENTKVEDFVSNGDTVSATLQLQNLLESDTEYTMELVFTTSSDQKIYYYTRVMLEDDIAISDAMDFALSFHDETLSDSDGSDLATYIEPDSTASTDSLQTVTINSTLDQIMWADFDPQVVGDVTVQIAEMNSSYQSIILRYQVTSGATSDSTQYYLVEEYYRVRVGEERVYLLEYERTMEQIFEGTTASISDTLLNLGVRDTDVTYASNPSGTIVAFVQAGELWLYDEDSAELTEIYGTISSGGDTDVRDLNGSHEILICKMDESGSMDFLVYGYMDRGEHEGETGIGVYRYDSSTGVVTEEVFLPSDKSYEVLKEEVGDLVYINSDDHLLLLVDQTLYNIDMENQTAEKVLEGLSEGSYVVSESNRYIAWIDDLDSSTNIQVMDLNTLSKSELEAESGTYIRPLSYLGEDLVYGEANQSDLLTNTVGSVTFPMATVKIVDEDLSLLKTYDQDGSYVISVYLEDDVLHLERVTISGDTVTETDENTIISYANSDSTEATITTATNQDALEQEVLIQLSEEAEDTSPHVATASIAVQEQTEELTILQKDFTDTIYFVYRGLQVVMSSTTASDAIIEAYDDGGVVVSSDGGYIWTRNTLDETTISGLSVPDSAVDASSIAQCLDAILDFEGISNNAESYFESGLGVYDTMTEILEDATILDLCGCTVSEVLYYVSNGTPVLALTDEDDAVLIVGYDSYTALLFYPESGETEYLGLEDSETLFSGAGSIFFGYLP